MPEDLPAPSDAPPGGWRLRVLAEDGSGRTWALAAPRIEIGRWEACHIRLHSPYAKGIQVRLSWDAGRGLWVLETTGHPKQTLVNGWAIEDVCPLLPGDVVQLVGATLRLERDGNEIEPAPPIELVALLHRGPLFETWKARRGEAWVCVKQPLAAERADAPAETIDAFRANWSMEFSRLVSLIAKTGEPVPRAPAERLLADEGARIRASAGAWHHQVLDETRSDDGRLQLVMPLYDGEPLRLRTAAERRRLLPRLLPGLWDALARAVHGDVQPGNLIADAAGSRFHLIDPCASVYWQTERVPGDSEQDLLFTTTPAYYPLLPPYHRARFALAEGPSLADHLEDFLTGASMLSFRGRVGEHTLAAGFHRRTVGIGEKARDTEPHPGDLQALGIAYYEALTGHHPFFDSDFPKPAWLGGALWDGTPKHFATALERVARPVVPPSRLADDVTRAEDELALALVTLQVPDRAALVGLQEAVSP